MADTYTTPKPQGPRFLSSTSPLPKKYTDIAWKRKNPSKALNQDPRASKQMPAETFGLSQTILSTTLPSVFKESLAVTEPNLDTPASPMKRSAKKSSKSKKK